MNEIIDKLYGLVLTLDGKRSSEVYRLIEPDWNMLQIHKDLHESIGNLMDSGADVNLLTVSEMMRDKGMVKKDTYGRISQISSSVGGADWISYQTLFNNADYLYKQRRAMLLTTKLSESLQSGVFSVERYREWLEKGLKELAFNVRSNESNPMLIDQVLESHDRASLGEVQGVKLHYNTFNRVVLLEDVDLMVMGARPAMGKTAFAISTAIGWAFQSEIKVAIFALEMSKTQMMRRVLANLSGVDSNKIKYGELNNYERSKIASIKERPEMDNLIIFEGSHSISDIAAELNRLRASGGVDVAIVDYLQKVKPSNPNHSMYEAVTYASNGLKNISQNMKIPILALAQLSRDSAKVGKRPSLPDLRQSGEIEQDASIVGFIHRPEYYGDGVMESGELSQGMGEIIIAKNREGECGVYDMKINLKISKFMDSTAKPIISGGQTINDDNPF